MASTLFIKFLSHFYERFSMHTSVFKLVWASLACIQVKFLYICIIKKEFWSFWLKGFSIRACILGLFDCIRALSYFCVFISIVSPFLLSYLNSKVKWMMQVCHVMLCKFAMLWYASLSCYVMQVWYASSSYDMQICYASLGWSFCSCYHVMQAYLEYMDIKLQALCSRLHFDNM